MRRTVAVVTTLGLIASTLAGLLVMGTGCSNPNVTRRRMTEPCPPGFVFGWRDIPDRPDEKLCIRATARDSTDRRP